MMKEVVHFPVSKREFVYLAAAIIGTTFNPWMVFYQQSAIVDKKLQPTDYGLARCDTATGAALTQLLTGAVLVSVAATVASSGGPAKLDSVAEISKALAPILGANVGRLIFSLGVLGASLVAAIVSSLALAWGLGEVTGYRHSLEHHPFEAGWFYGVYAACVIAAGALVWLVPDLVWLNISAQVLNVFLLPLVIAFLVALATEALPEPIRLRGWYLGLIIGISAVVCAVGLFGGITGWF